jgi:hypothetical protein
MISLMLRPPSQVMKLERLGVSFASRLSFMRTLVRHMAQDKWSITYSRFKLDKNGYGHAVFDIQTPHSHLSMVIFSQCLDNSERSDRVIADKWDLTMTLLEGLVDEVNLARLAANVPLQEKGRIDARSLSLARANRSTRIFNTVLNDLRVGKQPDATKLAQVGYLYRTTAVYGSGKFGSCDWDKILKRHPDLARPFASEMLVCYLIRQFSLDQLDHMVHQDDYPHAVSLAPELQRYLGIGNSTGLGMAPWLINHPMVFSQWVLQRETAYAEAIQQSVTNGKLTELQTTIDKAFQHVHEINTVNESQQQNNATLLSDLAALRDWINDNKMQIKNWQKLHDWAEQHYSLQGQELLVSLLLELYPQCIDGKEDHMKVVEVMQYDPTACAKKLVDAIEDNYDWAFVYNFDIPKQNQTFWYYSQAKMEPRLGEIGIDEGVERQMFLGIAKAVQECHTDLLAYLDQQPETCIADFLLAWPKHAGIVQRIITMSQTTYGEIRANLLDAKVLPIYLLRAKLAYFGVSKFDPKSRLWVRNTMFQGAPLISELSEKFMDDWCFPISPQQDNQQAEHG